MTTPITLAVGDITLTFNKWTIGVDHGMLFQERDNVRRRSAKIDYEYYAEHSEKDLAQNEMCLCRTLGAMVPRLELLGYTLGAIRAEFDACVREDDAELDDSGDDDPPKFASAMSFEEFLGFVLKHAVAELSDEFVADYDDHTGQALKGRFAGDPDIARLPRGDRDRDRRGYSERSHFGNLIGFLQPYSVLRVLAENPRNLDLDVVWDYGAFVDAGWAENSDFVPCARRGQTYLIATEGTSDTHILRRAFQVLRPDISDFFRFIDVEESHPFSGTGNLSKFAEGLVKIDVHNRVVFLFDNDAEGRSTCRSLERFTFPVNMRAMMLPDIPELRTFPARGPNGVAEVDINGRAAAIECYLDLRLKGRPSAQVTWTNFKKDLDDYQGALDFKESYAKAFYEASESDIASGKYDITRLRAVLDAILRQCYAIAEDMLLSTRKYVRR